MNDVYAVAMQEVSENNCISINAINCLLAVDSSDDLHPLEQLCKDECVKKDLLADFIGKLQLSKKGVAICNEVSTRIIFLLTLHENSCKSNFECAAGKPERRRNKWLGKKDFIKRRRK